ncbi:MAG: hypothetical protein A2017_01710 [Lentisphaerae bacterium GWF2_44_16]|nr:MAG: hypothetical protein A2017_01710 [Lentisphaerae bacterium GWF2_44_16]
MKEAEAKLLDLKEKFEKYYGFQDVDIFGNTVLKDMLYPTLPVREYDNFFKWCNIIQLLLVNKFVNIKGYRILDAGCGNGQDLRKFIELGAKSSNCYGIDFAENAIDFARENSPSGVTYKAANFDETGFEDDFFDIVVSFNTIVNFKDDEYLKKINDEFRRIIKGNGMLLLICAISADAQNKEGFIKIPVRIFTLDEVQRLFPDFTLRNVLNGSANIPMPSGGTINAGSNTIDLKAFSNLYSSLHGNNDYRAFYVEGAVKHLCSGLGIMDSSAKLMAFSAK